MTRWIELTVANFCHVIGNEHCWSAFNSHGNKVSLFWLKTLPFLSNSFQLRYCLTPAQMKLVQFVLAIRAYSLAGTSTALN
jgi:hypothetical protein